MAVDFSVNTPLWFVLNYIGIAVNKNSAQNVITLFNEKNGTSLQLFAPTYIVRKEKDGKYVLKYAKLTFHYVFVKGRFEDIKHLCAENNGFSFVLNRSSEDRYAIISDQDMQNFKNIARAYENCLPYYPLDEIDLEDGDVVEVVNGDFPGLVGTFMPKPKSKSGNVVLMVYNNVGTIAYNIHVSDVRVIEFAKNSTRANDQIDAIVSHLLKALKHFYNHEIIPKPLLAKLSLFCMRMGVVKIGTRKLDAKLQALLYAGNFLLGNMAEAGRHKAHYEKIKNNVSNVWTEALICLLFYIIEQDNQMLVQACETMKGKEPKSKFQNILVNELQYYNTEFIRK